MNRKVVPDLSLICHRSKIQGIGKTLISTLKELIPRQQFEVALQAAVGGHVISRDNVKAYRKDVTAKLVFVIFTNPAVWRRSNSSDEAFGTPKRGKEKTQDDWRCGGATGGISRHQPAQEKIVSVK